MTTDESRTQIHRFVRELERLAERKTEDRAALARLKRCAGRPLAESLEALPLLYELGRSGIPEHAEEQFFLVATLFPFAPSRLRAEEAAEGRQDFGGTLRWLATRPKVNADGVDRRVTVLLDADRDELPFRLRQAVRMLAQHDPAVDWRLLLRHLLAWESPSRWVQKRWARSYFGLAPEPSTEEIVNAPVEETLLNEETSNVG